MNFSVFGDATDDVTAEISLMELVRKWTKNLVLVELFKDL